MNDEDKWEREEHEREAYECWIHREHERMKDTYAHWLNRLEEQVAQDIKKKRCKVFNKITIL